MNSESGSTQCCRGLGVWLGAILGTFLIVAALVWIMYAFNQPVSITQARAEERAKNLAELRAADFQALANMGWADQAKGVVRLPIAVGMALIIKEYSNPDAARSNLLARAVKAAAPPPNPFE